VTDPTRLAGYELEDELGAGAIGVVYRARTPDGGLVALKVLRRELGDDQEFLRRFAREVRAAEEVEHPNLVRILDAGEAEGRPYLALEYVSGGTLERRLVDGPLPLADTIRAVTHVAGGLDALHRAGLVHRDVKPSNVLLREDSSAALTDFGLAKGTAYTVLTRPGQILGTLDYLAPELVRGEEAAPATDIYALGCVAYECVAGRPPFADRSLFGVGTAHLEEEPPDPPAGPQLAWAIGRALEKDPAARPPTATAYAHLLRSAAKESE
jgi:serine/threonine-protein kinase